MHKAAKVGIAVVTASMFTGGGLAAYNLWNGITGGSKGSDGTSAVASAATPVAEAPSAETAAKEAKAFLAAWAAGDYEEAGQHTDQPGAANLALARFRDDLKPTAVALVPAAATGTTIGPDGLTVSFKARVEFAGAARPWEYDGRVAMVKLSDGRAVVHWDPSVVHPKLTNAGKALAVRPVTASLSKVVDRKGRPVAEFPSIAALLGQVDFGTTDAPTEAGQGVVVTQSGGATAPEPLFTITEPKNGEQRKLTIDADLQRAAEAAVKERSGPASIVAIEPSTGHVLALANNPASSQNRAFTAVIAPGSTMKVVTAAALLESGLTPDTPLACPKNTDAGGRLVPNDFPDARLGYTFKDDFAQSCNTAFIEAGRTRLSAGSLPAIAKEVFGLGQVWRTGLSNFDTKIPAETNAEQIAMAYIGQGRIQTNALAMASVSATVQSGVFRQPILVPGLPQSKAARRLDGTVLGQLQSMMRRAVQSGTAAEALGGIPGAAGKTGTAEVSGRTANSWFTGYRGNLAVAAEVEGAGHGSDAAAPAVGKLLQLGNNG
ncbi:penicillin-binding transpeptidase domain-containing protein [Kitasatospora sp. NPDC001664]|uniref:penicillin-binding transpeptidase domain-containing protein n=1 Tax=Kitasatospora albolonga TaxID=68173 RepID=UPI0035E7309B